MRVTVVHNPSAGGAQPRPEALESALAAAGHEVRWQSLKEDGGVQALAEPTDLVAVAGGDGSVRKVFLALAGTQVPVTLLPVGSANNIARSLGLEDDDPAGLIRAWEGGRLRPFDIGAISVEGGSHFVESAGGGLFADVLARAKASPDDPTGDEKVERGLRLLVDAVTAAEPRAWRVAVDGQETSRELLGVEAMNVRESGPNVPLAPEADPGDSLLEAVLIRPEHRQAFVDYLEARLGGSDPGAPGFEVLQGRRIELGAPAGAQLHVDSKLVAGIPSRAAASTHAQLRVLVPARR